MSRERRRVALAAREAVSAVSADLMSKFLTLESKVNRILDLIVNEKVQRDERTQERINRLEMLLVVSPAMGPSVGEVLTQMMDSRSLRPVLEPKVDVVSMVPKTASDRHVAISSTGRARLPFVPAFPGTTMPREEYMNEDEHEEDKKGFLPHEDTLNEDGQKDEKNVSLLREGTVNEDEQKGEKNVSLPHEETGNVNEQKDETNVSMLHELPMNEDELKGDKNVSLPQEATGNMDKQKYEKNVSLPHVLTMNDDECDFAA